MATLFITECSGLASGSRGSGPQAVEVVTTQIITTLSTTSQQSSAVNSKTRFILVHADADCHVLTGDNPTATATAVSGTVFLKSGIYLALAIGGKDLVACRTP